MITLQAGEILFEESDPCDGVYIVREGFIEIGKHRDGDFLVLAKMRDGDVIGTMSLFSREPRSASARAVGSARLIHIDDKTIESSFLNLPVWVQAVLKDCTARLKNSSEELVEAKLREKRLYSKLGTVFHSASQLAAMLAYGVRSGTIQDEGISLFPLKGFFERCEGVLLKRAEHLETLFLAFMKGSLVKAQDDKKWGRSVFSPNPQVLEDFSVFCLQASKNNFESFVPSKFTPVLSALIRVSKKEKIARDYPLNELIERVKAECGKSIDAGTVRELLRLRVFSQTPISESYTWSDRQLQRRLVFESTCRFIKDAQFTDLEQKVA